MVSKMDNDRLILGIGRLEQALTRVERAAARIRSAPPPVSAEPLLVERHRRLRETMEGAVARIDAILGRQEG